MRTRIRRGRRERAARKRHRRGSIWTNYGPAAGQTFKLGSLKWQRYNRVLWKWQSPVLHSSRTVNHPAVVEAERQETPARTGVAPVGLEAGVESGPRPQSTSRLETRR